MKDASEHGALNRFLDFWRRDSQYRNPVALYFIFLIGLAFRLYGLGERSLWGDEFYTIAHALGNIIQPEAAARLGEVFDPQIPQALSYYRDKLLTSHGIFAFGDTVKVLSYNNHPPLFFWLMNMVIHWLGSTPAMLRMPALVAGLACIPMMYLLGRKIHTTTLGLFAAAVLAFSGYQIYHAQDARPYTLITLFAVTSLWLLLRAIEKASRNKPITQALPEWLGITVLSIAGLYTHYFYGPFLVFLYLYGVLRQYRNPRFITAMSLCYLAVTVAFYPWLDVLRAQLVWVQSTQHYTTGLWDPIQVPEYVWRFLNEFLMPKDSLIKIAIVMLFLYSMGIFFYLRRHSPQVSPLVQMCLLWISVIFGFQILFDVMSDSSTLTIRRYTLLAAPAYYLLVACALANTRTRERMVQLVVLVLFFGLMFFNSYQVVTLQTFVSQQYREAAQLINDSLKPGDVVLVNPSGPHVVAMAYYLQEPASILGINSEGVKTLGDRQRLDELLNKVGHGVSRIWLVLSDSAPSTRLTMETNLTDQDFYARKPAKFHGVEVVLYEKIEEPERKMP